MRVVCTGPESSGTRVLTRTVNLLDVEAIHRSIPHAERWWDMPSQVDAFIFISRDPFITEMSGLEANHINHCGWKGIDREYPYRLTNAWREFANNVIVPREKWIPLTFEGFVARPQWTLDHIAEWLGVESATITEKIVDPRAHVS